MDTEIIELADALFESAQQARIRCMEQHVDLPTPSEIVADLPGWTIAEAESALRLAGAMPVWCGKCPPCWQTAHEHVRWIAPAPSGEAFEANGIPCVDVPKVS